MPDLLGMRSGMFDTAFVEGSRLPFSSVVYRETAQSGLEEGVDPLSTLNQLPSLTAS